MRNEAYGAGLRQFLKKKVTQGTAFLFLVACTWGSVREAWAREGDLPPSVFVDHSWKDSIRLIYNRGEGAVSFLSEQLELLNPDSIAKLPSFQGFENLRVTMMAFEFRSMEIFRSLRLLIEKGASLRLVLDPSTYTLFEPASEETIASWTPTQKKYYLKNYDHNDDGVVDAADAEEDNRDYLVTHRVYQELLALQKAYPKQVELIAPPHEIVPVDRSRNYPRMMHYKISAIETRSDAKSKDWRQQKAIIGSANPTDSCLNRRLSPGKENIERYISGVGEVTYVNNSEGNIQFGAVIEGEATLTALKGPIEEWIGLFEDGGHFDDSAEPLAASPRIVFKEKDLARSSVLQAVFSEGQRLTFKKPSDPLDSITRILMQPEIKLKVYYDSQFVFSHGGQARNLRRKLADSELEEFGVFVDGNFATQPYSAMAELLFSPRMDMTRGVMARRAVQNTVEEVRDWQDNVFVFEGERGIFGVKGDKLHTKLSYFEYETPKGERHHLVVFGSANKSTKAGRMNADGLLVLDSLDPQIGVQMRKFFTALRAHRKMRPFASSWLEFNFLEFIHSDGGFFTSKLYDELPQFLTATTKISRADRVRYFKKLSEALRVAAPATEQGEFFVSLMQWFSNHSKRLLDWQELAILFRVSVSKDAVEEGVLEDLRSRWLGDDASRAEVKAFDAVFAARQAKGRSKLEGVSKALQEIINECEAAAAGWGLTHREREQ